MNTTTTTAAPDGLTYPTKRDEAWRYAPHGQIAELTFAAASEPLVAMSAELVERIPVLEGARVVVVNGIVDRQRSSLVADADLYVAALADAASDRPDLLSARRHRSADDVDAYSALNFAFGVDGAVIEVADGAVVAAPIHIVDVALARPGANAACTGVVIHVGAGASATIVETRLGDGIGPGGSNVHTSITLGDDATVEHVIVQDLGPQQIHLSRVEITQGARSTSRVRSFNLGASYGRLAYQVRLAGAGAFTDMSGLFFGTDEQILDQQITVVHAERNGTSRQSYRGVLDGSSTGVFNGGIDVCPGADGTDAAQSNDNLLLSMRAEINTQPRLEILADEVACKHGATVGQLDDTALYYLRSRGIGAEEARRMLVNGFADQAVDDVGVEALRKWITKRLGHDHD